MRAANRSPDDTAAEPRRTEGAGALHIGFRLPRRNLPHFPRGSPLRDVNV
jgi:hypothetical protein